jgi:hypothetical protein
LAHQNVSRRVFGRTIMGTLAVVPFVQAEAAGGWIDLFDGQSLKGWKPSEHTDSWKVVDGTLAANGPRSHLFYDGQVRDADFQNFELEVELTTQPECNSGIYFHTRYQESGFPEKGFEIQINNTAHGDGGYLERKKTASLYGLRNMYKQLVPDEKPFQVNVLVRGKNVQIRLDGQLLVDYIEPTPPVIPEGGEKERFLDRGTFALQCHNDGSKVRYHKVRVRPLKDNSPSAVGKPLLADDVYRQIINIGRHNVPIVDYHVFLRNGMSLEQALHKSRQDGVQYGLTALSSSVKSEADAEKWLRPYAGKPVFYALYAVDKGWLQSVPLKAAQKFDYVLADNRTWTSEKGSAVRLWEAKEAAAISDREAFMDSLVAQAVERLNTEPIDIYSHATYLPAAMKTDADKLWTEARMGKLIDALVKNKVAVELNTLDQLPGQAFVEQAKAAGCKFGFGTANQSESELTRCEYGLRMVEECKLDWKNFFAPGGWYPKAVERRGDLLKG